MLKSKLFWSRYVELVIALVAFGWLVADYSWEPLALLITSIAALVGSEIAFLKSFVNTSSTDFKPPIQGQLTEDRKLYDRLIQLLPSDGIIDFINKQNMAGWSFNLDLLKPLDAFIHTWNNSSREFLDPDLEHAKTELYARCREYSSLIARYTFPNENGEQSVPPEWEIEQPEKFDQAVKELHDKAQELVDAHERIVRQARRKLNL